MDKCQHKLIQAIISTTKMVVYNNNFCENEEYEEIGSEIIEPDPKNIVIFCLECNQQISIQKIMSKILYE